MNKKITKSDSEWKKTLNDQEYHILREKGTERAFTGNLYDNHEEGMYYCAGCGNPVFSSETKFDSESGWPSFYAPVVDKNVDLEEDKSFGMRRTEVLCSKCGGHLGHVFDDGPNPTGLRYCINSCALHFDKKNK
jgi:peptide-methionine (R)-S-oxide reductase